MKKDDSKEKMSNLGDAPLEPKHFQIDPQKANVNVNDYIKQARNSREEPM